MANQESTPDIRLERAAAASVRSWHARRKTQSYSKKNVSINCGWGRLLFGQTFDSHQKVIEELARERQGERDIAFYVREPHVLTALAPQDLFLDPSHSYRMWLEKYHPKKNGIGSIIVRRIVRRLDLGAIRRIYERRGMLPPDEDFLWKKRNSRSAFYLVAEDVDSGTILGSVMGLDHKMAFEDPENGSSLWALVVDTNCAQPGVGEALTRYLLEKFAAVGREFMDLSVMHDNEFAIRLYEKLGFERVPVFCVKRKNPINEALYVGPRKADKINYYSRAIVSEARRRGIRVDILDPNCGYYTLSFGGKQLTCRESLTDLTSS
ncbi:MAG: GNAT family N-acetyltransferase, partial [Bdellovibrionales bacterium]|nr:GNAT family N-acetyltransferase [Bdellovibrionales bacterium]